MSLYNRELNCLYGLSNIANRDGVSLDIVMQEAVDLIQNSWQYPEDTCVRICMDTKEFKTDNFKETKWTQAAELKVDNKRRGVIEVFYLKEKPKKDEGPFLKEERLLINAVSERLNKIIRWYKTENQLIQFKKDLINKDIFLNRKEIALREILTNIEQEKNTIKQYVAFNVENLIMPVVERISEQAASESQQDLELLKKNLNELVSSFGLPKQQTQAKMSSREIEICNMVKHGFTSKDIAQRLSISYRTVENHRHKIKKKLNVSKHGITLSSYLKSI